VVGEVVHKPVLVGISGGLDSMVAAYLLKIQKRQLYAAIIASTPEDFQEEGDSLFACHQSEARLKAAKKFCDHLQIPLTVIRLREEFQEDVLDPWLSAKILGKRPRQCQDCHAFRLRLLWKHMKELKCETMATGHFAKLVRSSPGAPVAVHSSNDLESDQAGLLALLPQEILSSLELPLSELQHKEVVKIAGNFNLSPPERIVKFGACLPVSQNVTAWMNSRVAKKLNPEVEIIFNDSLLERHEGVTDLNYGQPWKEFFQHEKPQLMVAYDWSKKVVHVAESNYFLDSAVFLTACHWGEGVDLSTPSKGFLHFGGGLNDREVLVRPRTLGGAWVELVEGEKIEFPIGLDLVIYRRRGKNAKVLVTGVIHLLGREWGKNTIEMEGNGAGSKNGVIELDKDFNF
jgi:tRNA-specific 2-thiouridylase